MQEACKYFAVDMVLNAKMEFCKPKGIGVNLDRRTS